MTILFFATSVLQACSMTGRGLDEATVSAIAMTEADAIISPDPFAGPEDASGSDRDRLLDEDTIKNAVTSAGPDSIEEGEVSWSNPSTGSAGTITQIEQRKTAGQICRSFAATREAYDGVTLYRGDLCLDRRTGWWTRMLQPADRAG